MSLSTPPYPQIEGSTTSGQRRNQFASGAKAKYSHTAPRITRTISTCVQYLASCRFQSTKRMYRNILIRPSATLFSRTLSCQCLLYSPLLTGLQIIGVTLYVPNDVLRLNLAFEPTECILQRLALMQSNFSQTHHPHPALIRHIKSLRYCAALRCYQKSTALSGPVSGVRRSCGGVRRLETRKPRVAPGL